MLDAQNPYPTATMTDIEDPVEMERKYYEGLKRMLGQYGIDQMSAAVDLAAAALQWYEEDWDPHGPVTDAQLKMAEAAERYHKFVDMRSKRGNA